MAQGRDGRIGRRPGGHGQGRPDRDNAGRRPARLAGAAAGPSRRRSVGGSAIGGAGAGRGGRPGLCRFPARRGRRVRQNGGLFRGDCRGPAPGPTSHRAAAGDRAHRAMARPVRAALRRPPGAMAFRPDQNPAAPDLARGGDRRSPGRRRCPLCPHAADAGDRPDRRRRRARPELQAGRRRRLSRPGYGRRPGDARKGRRGPRLSDAVAGIHRQCRARPLRPSGVAGAPRRRAAAGDRTARFAPGSPAARPLARRPARQGNGGNAGGGRTSPALSQPPGLCAAHLVPHLRPAA